MVIWNSPCEEVDMVVDFNKFDVRFRPGIVKVVYAFDIFEVLKPEEVPAFLKNIYDMLGEDGELYIIENDFDYINRCLLSAELSIKEFNASFRRNTYVTQQAVIEYLSEAGFPVPDMRSWQNGLKFIREHYQLIMSAKKTK